MEEKNLKSKVIFGTIWKLMERIIAQLVSMIVSIILARLLTPEDYSSVSLVIIFFAFANILISGGFNSAQKKKKDSDKLDFSTILIFSVAVSLIIYIVLFFYAPAISRIYHRPELVPVIRVMGISLPITAVKSIWCAYISSKLMFKKFFFATIGGTIMSAVVGIAMAAKGFGVWALVAQQMTNTTVDTIILMISTPVSFGLRFSFSRFRQLFAYGWKIIVTSIIGTVYTQVVPLFIGARYSNHDLSFYTKGRSFPELLSSTTTYTVSAVLFPFLSKFQDRKEKLLEYTRLYIRLSSFLTFPLMLGFFAISETFVRVVLTEKWLPAVPYIRVFCLASMFDMCSAGNCETIKAMGRSDVYLVIEIIKKTSYFIVLALFLTFTREPVTLAYAFIVCAAIAVVVNAVPSRKLIGYKFTFQLMDLLPNLLLSVLMSAIVIFVGKALQSSSIVTLLAQVLCGIVVYLLLCICTGNKDFKYMLHLAKTIQS